MQQLCSMLVARIDLHDLLNGMVRYRELAQDHGTNPQKVPIVQVPLGKCPVMFSRGIC